MKYQSFPKSRKIDALGQEMFFFFHSLVYLEWLNLLQAEFTKFCNKL